jgi:uncharacterized protein YkwD
VGGGHRKIVPLVVVAAALSSAGAAGVAATNENAASPAARWHSPVRLDVVRDRLKRTPGLSGSFRRAGAYTPVSGWRHSGHVDRAGERPNVWRMPRPTRVVPQAPRSYESALLASVNSVRGQHGLRPLRLSHRLSAAADLHSTSMSTRGFFAHESADGSPFHKRVERYYASRGYRMWSVGENLVWGTPEIDPHAAVQAWMESPGHRANLLSREWREIGLGAVHRAGAPGVYQGRPVTIVTADFGVRF